MKQIESFDIKNNCEIVISRYNENLEWIKEEPFNKYNITVYNKGNNTNFITTENIKKINSIENLGKCDHTYLYHIINNYDNLSDITIFLPGSCEMDYKKVKAKRLINVIEEKEAAVFLYDEISLNIKTRFYDFSLNDWETSNSINKEINKESKLTLSEFRPFGKWFAHYFEDIVVKHNTYFGIFSVAKEDILQKPKEYYENLIKQLSKSSNPEVGHYFERAWAAVFHPMTSTILIENVSKL